MTTVCGYDHDACPPDLGCEHGGWFCGRCWGSCPRVKDPHEAKARLERFMQEIIGQEQAVKAFVDAVEMKLFNPEKVII